MLSICEISMVNRQSIESALALHFEVAMLHGDKGEAELSVEACGSMIGIMNAECERQSCRIGLLDEISDQCGSHASGSVFRQQFDCDQAKLVGRSPDYAHAGFFAVDHDHGTVCCGKVTGVVGASGVVLRADKVCPLLVTPDDTGEFFDPHACVEAEEENLVGWRGRTKGEWGRRGGLSQGDAHVIINVGFGLGVTQVYNN
jgi:hypothetical protein